MSATHLRDQIFSRVHAEVLRPAGFRKTGRWIYKQAERFHYAIERPQHRYETPEHATLAIEVYVFHEAYHSLMIGWPTFPGVDRMSIPVFNRGLRWMAPASEALDHVKPDTDIAAVSASIGSLIESVVLPLFGRASTLAGLQSVVTDLVPDSWQRTKTVAGLLVLQNLREEARTLLQAAVEEATGNEHEELIKAQAKLLGDNDA